jgi:hypothetical protein
MIDALPPRKNKSRILNAGKDVATAEDFLRPAKTAAEISGNCGMTLPSLRRSFWWRSFRRPRA